MSEPTLVPVLKQLLTRQNELVVRFPQISQPAPELAMSVSFPRLEIVLEGELADGCLEAPLGPLQALYGVSGCALLMVVGILTRYCR